MLSASPGSGSVANHASSSSWATSGVVSRSPMTSTLASFHFRAPAAVAASVHSAARTPGTLFAAIDAPVPVQQNRTPVSISPLATSSPTRWPTSAHSMGSPPGGPTSTTSWPRCSRSSRTALVRAVFSSDPSASFIALQGTAPRARQAALHRREFLRRTAQLGGAVALSGPALAANARVALAADDFGSMLDNPAKESPVDTVVVVMMENRSFDHYFGWLATDPFAPGSYGADAMPFTSQLAREFTVCDRWHASVLGPTYPNRAYLHSGQSGDYKTNMLPFATGGYDWETIWDRLGKARIPAAYYYTDLPVLALWGGRLDTFAHPIADYFAQAKAGKLPRVVF